MKGRNVLLCILISGTVLFLLLVPIVPLGQTFYNPYCPQNLLTCSTRIHYALTPAGFLPDWCVHGVPDGSTVFGNGTVLFSNSTSVTFLHVDCRPWDLYGSIMYTLFGVGAAALYRQGTMNYSVAI